MKIFENFDLKIELQKKGTKQFGFIPVSLLPNGSWVQLPIMIAVGAKDGPTILADGCHHGDEYEGAEAIADVFNQLDVSTMSGSFVGVPALNIQAFGERSRYNTVDYVPVDMNRAYPGSPVGTISQYLVHFYIENILKHCDALITIHGGGNFEHLEPLVLYCGEDTPVGKTSKEMAQAFGYPILWKNTRYKEGSGIADEHAYSLGIPAITPEIGGQSDRIFDLRETNVALTAKGIFNVLKYFHVLEGTAPKIPDLRYFDIDYIYNRQGGILKPLKKSMDAVKKDEVVAKIVDLFGQEVDDVRSPFDGVVLGYWTYAICQPHDWLYMIGKELLE